MNISLTMREGEVKPQTQNKNSYLRFSSMLASKLGKGMMLGGPRPKNEEGSKTQVIAPPAKVEATYEEVIEAKKTKVVKKKKPKRNANFVTGELIPIVKKPPPEEAIKEDQEQKQEEQKQEEQNQEEQKQEEAKPEEAKVEEPKPEEPKAEELKQEEPKPEEVKKEEIKIEESKQEENNKIPPSVESQEKQDKFNDIKNSVFNLFSDNKIEEEPKKQNLFEKVDLDNMPEVSEEKIPEPKNKIDLFSNNAQNEVQKSKLAFLDEDDDDKPNTNKTNKMFEEQSEKNANDNKIKVQPQPAKKKLAFFDDDD